MYQIPLFKEQKRSAHSDIDDTVERILLEDNPYIQRKMIHDWIQEDCPTFLVAFSGGKDSIAMFLHLLELGVPREKIELHHHDVDGGGDALFDWACTPSYCKEFAQAFGVPLYFSYREGGIAREMYRKNEGLQDVLFQQEINGEFIRAESKPGSSTKRMWPAIHADIRYRWCSSVAKIDVFSRMITNQERFKEGYFVICSGERRAESASRAKYNEFEHFNNTSKTRRALKWRPVIDWRDQQVWQIIQKHCIQPHPCYMMGFGRCSCQLCIFNDAKMWYINSLISPEKVDKVAQIEEDFKDTANGYKGTLHKDVGIRDFVRKGRFKLSDHEKALLDKWAPVATSEFKQPIIIDACDWVMPAGAGSKASCGAA